MRKVSKFSFLSATMCRGTLVSRDLGEKFRKQGMTRGVALAWARVVQMSMHAFWFEVRAHGIRTYACHT